jgi:hypothetical protein
MPEAADPMASIGYLVAAGAAALIGLIGYCVMLVQWTREANGRNARLRSEQAPERSAQPSETPVR